MLVTVCELDCESDLEPQWGALCEHTNAAGSQLVLLPEMPFAPWLPATRDVDPGAWDKAVAAHDEWLARLGELGAAVVATTRPVTTGSERFNEALVWDEAQGVRAVHVKTYLPDEPGFWEASWYARGPTTFAPADAGGARVGYLVCSELWFGEHARGYARGGVDIVASPRATDAPNVEKWLAGGRVAAISSGAFSLSSNRAGRAGAVTFGGVGWVIDPDGGIIERTSAKRPFVTVDIDLADARAAKQTYPRYVDDRPLA